MGQLHKKFSDDQVKDLFKRYLNKEIERSYVEEILGIGKARLFALLKRYRDKPQSFSIRYQRESKKRIAPEIETSILKELAIEKKLIQHRDVPLKSYNYSYIKDRLASHYKQDVSLPTIISRAKKNGFYLRKPKRTAHDREVLTKYVGQLIQHDASLHLWAPAAGEKWYLITSLDDFSRLILYATLLKKETTWAHIRAAETVFLTYGLPMAYYVDSHSIFRFVQGRDSLWRDHEKLTDDVDPQWKQVLLDCNVKVIHALSPQAKGKIERPYRWIQDRLVRSCVRENVQDIKQAQTLLDREINRYNDRQVHSTTLEIPSQRFDNALKAKQSLLRPFAIKPPYQSVKDIFCLRVDRTADAYRKVSINTLELRVNGASPGEVINTRVYLLDAQLAELRFWRGDRLLDCQTVKTADLKLSVDSRGPGTF